MKDNESRSRLRFFSGVVALTLGNLFVKVVGLVLKIPLHDRLGDAGMVYYNNAYDIYAWLFTVATTGLPTAISMLISEDRTKGNIKETKKIFRVTMALFIIVGIIGSSVMFFGAPFFERAYKMDGNAYCIVAIAPTLFFICVACALRGYFQGYQNMIPTAISEVIEALGKLVIGLLFAKIAADRGEPLPVVAAYAALGLTIGVAAGMIYLIMAKLLFKPEKYDFECASLADDTLEVRRTATIAKMLLMIAIPITISSSVQSFSTVIDGMMLSHRIQGAGFTQDMTKQLIGNYKTICAPLANLPPAFVAPVTASIIPLMAASIAQGNRKRTEGVISGALQITAILELPCALGMSVLSEPIIKMLFGNNESSERAAPLLSVLAISVFFVSMLTMTCAILQAHKLERKPIISMLVGAVVKISSVYIFAGIPSINIYGAPISSVLGGFAISAVNLYFIKKYIGYTPRFGKMMVRPLFASVICSLAAMLVFKLTFPLAGNNIALFCAIGVAVAVYFFEIFLFKALTREDVLLLPKGEKLARVLTKMRLLK